VRGSSLHKDMSKMILNTVQKKKRGGACKNLGRTRDLVGKLFIAVFANNAFRFR
jgi:hypothetical protein